MFETAELGRVLPEGRYDKRVPDLRTELLKAQAAIEELGIPVIVLIHGVDASGRGDILNLLNEWLDARYLRTETYEPPTEEERERPEYWRYWRWLPPRGRIGVFLGSWYTEPLWAQVVGDKGDAHEAALRRIESFERMLIDDGALIVKLWLHIRKGEQKRRLEAFEDSRKSRRSVTKRDWKRHERYADFVRVARRAITHTSTGKSPWAIIDAADHRFRNVSVGQHLLERMRARIADANATKKKRPRPPNTRVADPVTILDSLDLRRSTTEGDYRKQLPVLQARLARLGRKLARHDRGAVVVFEGWDAAGKGGAIRRISTALDARQYRVISTSAPTQEEAAHHYLWRFWRHVPRRGHFTIYDRSWYGRVLVERIEGFADEPAWQRAYREINDFEEQLVDDGNVVVKFWLHISKKEQLVRFEARRREPWKQHKLTADDFRNRAKSNAYELAVNDMLARTDCEHAPWTLVEAEDKRYCRVKVLETLCAALEGAL